MCRTYFTITSAKPFFTAAAAAHTSMHTAINETQLMSRISEPSANHQSFMSN